jgi:hypothetical protein
MSGGGMGIGRSLTSPRFAFGVAAIVAGVLFFADNLGWLEVEPLVEWWPLALVVAGGIKLLAGGVLWGAILMLGGSWLLLDNLGVIRIDFWDAFIPLALVGLGVVLVSRALGARALRSTSGDGRDTSGDAVVHANAVLGGIERTSRSPAFRGGDAFALMGGCEIDLRAAKLAPEGATLDVVAIWGGIEIWIPEDWDVDCQVMPIMGGVEERLARKTAEGGDGNEPTPPGAVRPRLVVRGVAIMGGIDIAHGPARSRR